MRRNRRLAFAIFIMVFLVVIVFVVFYLIAFSFFDVIESETVSEKQEIIKLNKIENSYQIMEDKDIEKDVEPNHPFTLYPHFVSRNMD